MRNNLHIVPHDSHWAIRLAGSREPLEEHESQQAAIEAAVNLAGDDEYHVVVHRQDGTFRNVIRYETIEKRLAARNEGHSFVSRPTFWGLLAAGAVAGIAAYLVLNPPQRVKHWAD